MQAYILLILLIVLVIFICISQVENKEKFWGALARTAGKTSKIFKFGKKKPSIGSAKPPSSVKPPKISSPSKPSKPSTGSSVAGAIPEKPSGGGAGGFLKDLALFGGVPLLGSMFFQGGGQAGYEEGMEAGMMGGPGGMMGGSMMETASSASSASGSSLVFMMMSFGMIIMMKK